MAYFDQEEFDIRCVWGANGVLRLVASDVIVIVDVLSFSTCVEVALARGAQVLPYRWKDGAAARYAEEHSTQLAMKCGSDGGGFSLSPESLMSVPAGLRLVLPSPNGSHLAFEAMSTGATVVAGCLRNAAAVGEWAQQHAQRITVIPAGERWPDGSLRPAIEDLTGAGAIISRLRGSPSPESQVAVGAFESVKTDIVDRLLDCSSGRELVEKGFARDVELAAEVDVSEVVPVLSGDAFVAATETEIID